MYSTSTPEAFNDGAMASSIAGQRCQEVLLNCYCREVAAPDGHLNVGPLFGHNDWPMSIRMVLNRCRGQVLQILLPRSGTRLLTVVSSASLTGNFRYLAPIYQKCPGKAWSLLDWASLATLLLRELAVEHDVSLNTELMEQIRNSVAVTATLLSAPVTRRVADDPAQAYIDSEQSLVYGHPYHPAPKSRVGFSEADMTRYSPEMQARFPLHYFAVRRETIVQQSLLAQPCDEIIGERAPPVDGGYVAIPTHPWQAGYLRSLPLVQDALKRGELRDLGTHGAVFYPTSSIRTLYQPGNPYSYKFSLNIRITNCVRKNAWYELESALQVTRVLRPLLPALYRQFEGLRVLEEPAFLSVDLRAPDVESNRAVIEGFGMILRQSVEGVLDGTRPVLSGALFGDHGFGEARLHHLVNEQAQHERAPVGSVIERWFSEYVRQLMYPVLHLYFAHGVVFEPHLQNVVIGIGAARAAYPRQVFLRDFEGVKLVPEHFAPEQLESVSERARASLWYESEQGWKRIAYCLFVNNFCEAIAQLGARDPALTRRLWALVRYHLHYYQSHYGNAASARRINTLLAGHPLPGKANLTNRFLKRPDRAVSYVPVANPIASAGEVVPWS